jgi:hypothetical protein
MKSLLSVIAVAALVLAFLPDANAQQTTGGAKNSTAATNHAGKAAAGKKGLRARCGPRSKMSGAAC